MASTQDMSMAVNIPPNAPQHVYAAAAEQALEWGRADGALQVADLGLSRHPGYTGFVGWQHPIRLRNGTLLVGFSTGYWHGSPPTPLLIDAQTLADWRKIGFPDEVDAPTGGRAMLIRSEDDGVTWSKPETIIEPEEWWSKKFEAVSPRA